MATIYNALDLKKGVKIKARKVGNLTQPFQFIPDSEKDFDWLCQNIDWIEYCGLRQVAINADRFIKNYKLSNGVIEKSDYIPKENNENFEFLNILDSEEILDAYELKFFPIIPNVINTFCGEYAKKVSKLSYMASDVYSYNEKLEKKTQMIGDVLMQYATAKMQTNLAKMGITEEDEQYAQAMSEESLKSLPEIEAFFKKDYRSLVEEWATHLHSVDMERFKVDELEVIALRDLLNTDRVFFHLKMMEDDYKLELWNPVYTFYNKSPNSKYFSQSSFIGNFNFATIPDVVDSLGWLMDKEQITSLENYYATINAKFVLPGVTNDGSYYDETKSHEDNIYGDSVAMRQYNSFMDVTGRSSIDVDSLLKGTTANNENVGDNYLRISTIYWMGQRLVGLLTKIDENGIAKEIVTEKYTVVTKPVYDTKVKSEKTKETLVWGEHIDWTYIPQAYSGIKIGKNKATHYTTKDTDGFNPIYLNLGPLPYQFKGHEDLYGAKLPVEGCILSERNSLSMPFVEKMKPFQIGFNIVNNQIVDIVLDEYGPIVMLDQNAIPKSNLHDDTPTHPIVNLSRNMRDGFLTLDTSITNTENSLNFNHYQVLNLEQSQRLLTRMQLAEYFKTKAYESVGFSQQRLGNVAAQETATGVEQAVNNSYSQTLSYFEELSSNIMPRVHEMRTDLAIYYSSTNPSRRLQYINSFDENVAFQLEGENLLLRTINVFVTTKINRKELIDNIKALAIKNNTTGESMPELIQIMSSESISEIDRTIKTMLINRQKQIDAQRQHESEMMDKQIQSKTLDEQAKRDFEAAENQKDREYSLMETTIANENAPVDTTVKDSLDVMKTLDQRNNVTESNNLKKESLIQKRNSDERAMKLKEKELNLRDKISKRAVTIAKVNKN